MKIKSFITLIAVVASFYIGFSVENKYEMNDISLDNVEALAGGEITMDFCVYQPDVCQIYDDGYTIKGVLQYSVTV